MAYSPAEFLVGEELEAIFDEVDEHAADGGSGENASVPPVSNSCHSCSLCSKQYASAGWLRRHTQLVHPSVSDTATVQPSVSVTHTPEQLGEVLEKAKESFRSRQVGEALEAEVASLTIESPILLEVHALIIGDMPLTATKRYREAESYHRLIRTKRASSLTDFGLSSLAFAHFVPAVYASWLTLLRAPAAPMEPRELTADERQALAYVGGFFLRKLRSVKSVETGPLIDSWTSDASSDHEFNEWTEQQDRGGLITINSEFFKLLVAMESVATACLSSVTTNSSIADLVFKAISENQAVRDTWRQHLEEFEYSPSESDSLLICLISSFCNLRCVAYAAASQRHDNKCTSKPSHSLRQSLNV